MINTHTMCVCVRMRWVFRAYTLAHQCPCYTENMPRPALSSFHKWMVERGANTLCTASDALQAVSVCIYKMSYASVNLINLQLGDFQFTVLGLFVGGKWYLCALWWTHDALQEESKATLLRLWSGFCSRTLQLPPNYNRDPEVLTPTVCKSIKASPWNKQNILKMKCLWYE